jgi:hypothetical protein
MEFSNLNYLFDHLPSRDRRDDGGALAPLDYFTPGSWSALIGSEFHVLPEDVDVILTAVTEINAEQFSMQFTGTANAIASGNKLVSQNLVGGLELFVSPIDFPALGHYEAAFNRVAPPAPAFLRRFLLFFGLTLDRWDLTFDRFYQLIEPATAPEAWINFWLWALFGWSWFPTWFTLARKRQLYADFTTHLARRGTKRGIEEFLKAFSVFVRVSNRPQYWGQFVWGAKGYSITDALLIVAQVSHLADEVNKDVRGMAWGQFVWGQGNYYRDCKPTLTRREIEDLLRFEWPDGQRMMVEYQIRRNVAGPESWDSTEPVLNEDFVPDENSGYVTQ